MTARQAEVLIDPPSIGPATTVAFTFDFPSAQPGDLVSAQPQGALAAGLFVAHARVSSEGTITLAIGNTTAAAINPPAGLWDVRIERVPRFFP